MDECDLTYQLFEKGGRTIMRKFNAIFVAAMLAVSGLAIEQPAQASCRQPLFRGGLLRRLCQPNCRARPHCRKYSRPIAAFNKRCVLHKLITADGITIYMVEDCDTRAVTSYFHTDSQLPGGGCDAMNAHCYTPGQDNTMTIGQPSLADPAATLAPGVTTSATGFYRLTYQGRTRTIKWHTLTIASKTVRIGFEVAPQTPAAPFAPYTLVRGMAVFEIQDSDPLPILAITRP